jgi:hypothetical protein
MDHQTVRIGLGRYLQMTDEAGGDDKGHACRPPIHAPRRDHITDIGGVPSFELEAKTCATP